MGIAASKRKTIVSTVSTGDGAWVSFLTDVSEMVDASKSCTHFICTPFFDYDSGIKGAFLVGLSGQPALPSVRTPILARLRVLAQLLSLALRHTAPAALCTIETVLGNHSGCEFCRRSESSVGSPRESIDAGSENDYEGSLRDEEDGGDDEESEEEEEEDYWRGGRPVERPVTPNTPIGIAHRLRISDSSARLTGCGSLTDSELELLPSRLSSSKAFCTESF